MKRRPFARPGGGPRSEVSILLPGAMMLLVVLSSIALFSYRTTLELPGRGAADRSREPGPAPRGAGRPRRAGAPPRSSSSGCPASQQVAILDSSGWPVLGGPELTAADGDAIAGEALFRMAGKSYRMRVDLPAALLLGRQRSLEVLTAVGPASSKRRSSSWFSCRCAGCCRSTPCSRRPGSSPPRTPAVAPPEENEVSFLGLHLRPGGRRNRRAHRGLPALARGAAGRKPAPAGRADRRGGARDAQQHRHPQGLRGADRPRSRPRPASTRTWRRSAGKASTCTGCWKISSASPGRAACGSPPSTCGRPWCGRWRIRRSAASPTGWQVEPAARLGRGGRRPAARAGVAQPAEQRGGRPGARPGGAAKASRSSLAAARRADRDRGRSTAATAFPPSSCRGSSSPSPPAIPKGSAWASRPDPPDRGAARRRAGARARPRAKASPPGSPPAAAAGNAGAKGGSVTEGSDPPRCLPLALRCRSVDNCEYAAIERRGSGWHAFCS